MLICKFNHEQLKKQLKRDTRATRMQGAIKKGNKYYKDNS